MGKDNGGAARGGGARWRSRAGVAFAALAAAAAALALVPGPSSEANAASRGAVLGWGGQAANADMGSVITAVSAGTTYTLAIRSDSTIVAWGASDEGQCLVPSPNAGFVAVSAGWSHGLALRSDGSLAAWGRNVAGQCNVPAPNANFVAVAAGSYHSLGLKSNGSIVGWGSNSAGQCNVPAPNASFRSVSAGGSVSLGLKADSTLVAWGSNIEHQRDIPAPNRDWVAVSASNSHCLGLKADGTIVAWGRNFAGQCDVPQPNTGFVAVAAGLGFSLGLKADGSIVVWGLLNGYAMPLPDPNEDFAAVAAGQNHVVGLKADGSVVVSGGVGTVTHVLPDGTDDLVAVAAGLGASGFPFGVGLQPDGALVVWGQWGDSDVQTVLPDRNADFIGVSVGNSHGVALRSDGTLGVWGLNNLGQGVTPYPNDGFGAIGTGSNHSLAVRTDGSLLAWGDDANGQCVAPTPNADFVAVTGGANHTLGLRRDGTIVAWGGNTAGQCSVPEPNRDFVAVAARLNHSLGLKADGTVVAWGDNASGQDTVPAPNSGFIAIAAGRAHNVALRSDGTVAIWGDNTYHEYDVPDSNARFLAIAAGQDLCLALRQLADPAPVDHLALTEVVAESGFDGSRRNGSDCFEIVNPTAAPIDLSQVYVTDAGDRDAGVHYYDIVRRGGHGGGGTNGDFHARFPAGATLAPGDTIVVAVAGSAQYQAAYNRLPDYELFEDYETPDHVPELMEVFPGSIGCGLGSGGTNAPDLDSAGETLVLYRWDGASDLVQDLDYVTWGPNGPWRLDKTGVAVDGPDADTVASAYPADVEPAAQLPVSLLPHTQSGSFQRRGGDEDGETLSGGGGPTGHVETSEPLAFSWSAQMPPTRPAPPRSWFRTSPIFTGLTLTPAAAGQVVTVEATVACQTPIASATLYWSINGSPFFPVVGTHVGGALWRGQIPALGVGSLVAWYVEAVTTLGARATYPAEAPIYANTYTVPPYPPSFSSATLTPASPYGGAPMSVSLRFSAAGGPPSSVTLYYRIGAQTTQVPAALDGTAWVATIPAQASGVVVEWYAQAQNAGGEVWYPAGAPATVSSFRVRDVSPPTGSLLAASGTTGSALSISALLSDDLGVANAWVFHRVGGTAAFDSVPMAASGQLYSGAVPGASIGAAGLQYYVRAEDVEGNRAWFPAGAPATALASAAVAVPAYPAFTLEPQVYRLAGVPLVAGAGAPDSVFVALGTYDPAHWRYLTTPYDAEAGGYLEYPAATPARAGQGFWIISREGAAIQVGGWATRLDQDFAIPLQPGWNLVALPFAFEVSEEEIAYPAGASGDLIAYTGDGYVHGITDLEPGSGYFLWHGGEAGAQLLVSPAGSKVSGGVLAKGRDAGASAKSRSGARARAVLAQDEPGWSLEVSARCGGQADTGNRCGVRAGATVGLDGYDLRDAPPAPGGQVSLYFMGEDGAQLYTDYRDLASSGETWTLRLTGRPPESPTAEDVGQPAVVRFALDRPLPADWQLLAVDLADLSETVLWPSSTGAATVEVQATLPAAGLTKTWRLIAGPADYVAGARAATRDEVNAAVTSYALGPIAPNPFRASGGTVLSLAIPRSGTVTLQVYDIRGRLVRTLQQGTLAQGLHRLSWDGRDGGGRGVPAGVYFARLKSGEVQLVEKVTVVR